VAHFSTVGVAQFCIVGNTFKIIVVKALSSDINLRNPI
jgi:hypothetical protein